MGNMELTPIVRRSVRLLAAVHELHKQGYQDLAIYAGMSSCGNYWRCYLAPFHSILFRSYSLKIFQNPSYEEAGHSSGKVGNEYFGWHDAKQDTARELAEKIKERFPKLLAITKRSNYEYTGWYSQMLGHAEQGHLPIMFDDYPVVHESKNIKTSGHIEIPCPPHEIIWEHNGKQFSYKAGPHLKNGDDWHKAYCDIIANWRNADIAYLPKYPIEMKDLFEMGAYWEGAIYYIQEILGFNRIDDFLHSNDQHDRASERWLTFHKVWNNIGQFVFLKAFLIRSMLNEKNKYTFNKSQRSEYRSWLTIFEQTYNPYNESCPESLPVNPYFGSSNPLHLGMILYGYREDSLIKI